MYTFDELVNIDNRRELIGMKAESLICLRENGFNVPDGFVITTDEINSFTDEELAKYLNESYEYAVRSSGTYEDLSDLSFAGQYDTFLNVKGIADIRVAIRKCAGSINNERVAAYAKRNKINIEDCKIAVIIQRMINSEKAGVAFSIDSINGLDKEIIIEAVNGLGEQLVSGHAIPSCYSYNWYDEKITTYNGDVLTQGEVKNLSDIILKIQISYGFPVDVEWAITGKEIHILQSRPITTIGYKAIPDEWTTADFRDGGVSAATCKALMGSLYGLVFNSAFLDSLKAIKLLSNNYNDSIYETFFARPYWCLTIEKKCFAKLPGFIEREIDNDMGIVPTYEGEGITTKLSLKSLWSAINTLGAVKKHIKIMRSKAESRKADLLKQFEYVEDMDLSTLKEYELYEIYIKFIKENYFISEYIYFSYIFCNMVLSTLFKDKIKKYIPANEIMNLMSGLSNVSHMRPIYDMWDMSRAKYSEDEFENFIKKYKHHSQHELDISFPNWDESPDIVKEMIADFLQSDDSQNPKILGENQKIKFTDTLSKLPKKLHKEVEQLRTFLWWREEFRDISTKSYYLIRKLTLALGKEWEKNGILTSADDMFFLTFADIASKNNLKKAANKNKQYYNSFINFNNPNEIGSRHTAHQIKTDGDSILKGIPCSGETITGTARVIKDIHDAHRITQGDILVTKCTDPAWTAVFSKISGVITETGGMLSHAAVVSREYGISCILIVKSATDVIKDGDIITMNCKTGEIFNLKGRKEG
jgi:pyruvate,water dikinase